MSQNVDEYVSKVENAFEHYLGHMDYKARNYHCNGDLYPRDLPFVLYNLDNLLLIGRASAFESDEFRSQFHFPHKSEYDELVDFPSCLVSYLKRLHGYIRLRHNVRAAPGDRTILVLVDDLRAQKLRPFCYFEYEEGYGQGWGMYIVLCLIRDDKVVAPTTIDSSWNFLGNELLVCLSPNDEKTRVY